MIFCFCKLSFLCFSYMLTREKWYFVQCIMCLLLHLVALSFLVHFDFCGNLCLCSLRLLRAALEHFHSSPLSMFCILVSSRIILMSMGIGSHLVGSRPRQKPCIFTCRHDSPSCYLLVLSLPPIFLCSPLVDLPSSSFPSSSSLSSLLTVLKVRRNTPLSVITTRRFALSFPGATSSTHRTISY